MKRDGRYDVSGLPEAEYEPGSDEQVLKNRLGIKIVAPRDGLTAIHEHTLLMLAELTPNDFYCFGIEWYANRLPGLCLIGMNPGGLSHQIHLRPC